MRKLVTISLFAVFSIAISSPAQAATWVEKSNEGAGRLGVDGLDAEISDLGPGINERSKKMSQDSQLRSQLRANVAAHILKDAVMNEFVPSQIH